MEPLRQQPPLLDRIAAPPRAESNGRTWWVILGSGVLGGLVLLHVFSPETSGFYPRCGLYVLTGLHCPGCGSLRALHHLTHGRLVAAVDSNALLVLGLFGGLAWGALSWIRHKPVFPHSGKALSRFLISVLIISAIFGLLRNLPWQPFAILAP